MLGTNLASRLWKVENLNPVQPYQTDAKSKDLATRLWKVENLNLFNLIKPMQSQKMVMKFVQIFP